MNKNLSGLEDLLQHEQENSNLFDGFISDDVTSDMKAIGKLQSAIKATIHTKQVAILMQGKGKAEGNNKFPVIGLYKFASMAAVMEANIKKDDPYADYVFYNLHEEIILGRDSLKMKVAQFKNWVSKNIPPNLKLSEAINVKPLVIELKFNSALAFQLAYYILELDEYFRLMKLAQHIALIDSKQANENINNNCKSVRRIMNQLYTYKNTEVTRNDCAANNQIAGRAEEAMPALAPLPDEFLSGEKRSGLAPFIPTRPENQTEEKVVVPESAELVT